MDPRTMSSLSLVTPTKKLQRASYVDMPFPLLAGLSTCPSSPQSDRSAPTTTSSSDYTGSEPSSPLLNGPSSFAWGGINLSSGWRAFPSESPIFESSSDAERGGEAEEKSPREERLRRGTSQPVQQSRKSSGFFEKIKHALRALNTRVCFGDFIMLTCITGL